MKLPSSDLGLARLLVLLGLAGQVAAKVDYFTRGCSAVVQKNKAWMEVMGMEYAEMYNNFCSSEDYARTMADCIVTFSQMPEVQGMIGEHTKTWQTSWNYLGWICTAYGGGKLKYTLDEALTMNSHSNISTTFAEADHRGGPKLFRVPAEKLVPYVGGSFDYQRSRWLGDVLGQTHVIYIMGVFAIQIFVNFVTWAHPMFYRQIATSGAGRTARWYFSVPPAFSRKFAHLSGTYLPRLHVIFLLGFFVLELISLIAGYTVSDSPFYADTFKALGNYIAVRGGYLSMYHLPLLLLFAGRNNFLIWFTGWNMDVFNLWHRWLARFVTIEVIIHAAGYTANYIGTPRLAQRWVQPFWVWGFVSLMCWAIMCVQAMRVVRRINYEVFLVVHIVLALLSLVGLYYHLWYTSQCKEEWYACWAIWGFDRIVRLVRVFRNGGVRKARAWSPGTDVVALDVPMPAHWETGPGGYVFMHFWTPVHFLQSHPFTVIPAKVSDARAADGAKHLKLVFKARNGLTRKILDRIVRSETETTDVRVVIDGPYGAALNFAPYDTLLFVAGGIGITAVYSHVRACGLGHASGAPRRIRVEWLVRDLEPVSCFADELAALADLGVHVVIHVTGSARSDEASICSKDEAKSILASPDSPETARIADSDGTSAPSIITVPLGQGLVQPDTLADQDDKSPQVLSLAVNPAGSSTASPASSPSVPGAGRLRDLTVVYNRPTAEELVLEAALDTDKSLHVFACGPTGMNHDLREAATEAIMRAPKKLIQFSEEGFTM